MLTGSQVYNSVGELFHEMFMDHKMFMDHEMFMDQMLFVEQILGNKLLAMYSAITMMCYFSQKDASENFLLMNLVLATRNNNNSELIYLVLQMIVSMRIFLMT